MAPIIETEPRPMRELVPITPPTLEWIVTRCLAKNPDDRWQTVRDLRAALAPLLQEPAAPASQRARASAVPWIVAALAVLVAIGIAAWSAATMRRALAGDTR